MGHLDGAHTHGGGSLSDLLGALACLTVTCGAIVAAIEMIAAIIWLIATIVCVLVVGSVVGGALWVRKHGWPRVLVGQGPFPAIENDRPQSARARHVSAAPVTYIAQQNVVSLAGASPEAVAAFVAAQRQAVGLPYDSTTDDRNGHQ